MDNEMISQLYSLVIYLISGICIGILFDIFRSIRKSFKTSDVITYIEDILFWILTGIILIVLIFVFSNGQLRLYNFIGIIIGIVIYIILISRHFIKVNVFFIKIIKDVIRKFIIVPLDYMKKIVIKLFKPITFFVINMKNFKKFKIKRRILKGNVEKYK